MNDVDVLVVGAGVAGLAAARLLESYSRFVTVVRSIQNPATFTLWQGLSSG